jgi:O-antigen/teichoic acid export membrane protein
LNFIKNYYLRYKDYLHSSFLYLFSAFFSAGIGLLLNPFMAKNLSPEDYAVMGYFNSFGIIVMTMMTFSLTSYYLRNYYKIDEDKRQIVVNTILVTLLIYGLFVLLVSIAVFYFYNLWANLSFPVYPYVLLAFAPIYFSNFVTLYLAKCRLERQAGIYSKLMIYSTILSAIFSILLVIVYKFGATGRMAGTLLAGVFPAIYSFKKMFGKFQFDFEVIKDAFRFGWPLSLSALLWYFLSGVDIAMLEKLKDTNTFGYYNVGLQISTYFAIFYTVIAQTFEPDIYKAIAENNKRKIIKIISGIIILNAIPNLIFIIFAPTIIGILTYNIYLDSTDFAQILALKNITITLYFSSITVIVGYGYTKSELLIRILGALICYIMFKNLIGKYGFYGAAWGQVISFVLMAFLSVVFLSIKLNVINNFKNKYFYGKNESRIV